MPPKYVTPEGLKIPTVQDLLDQMSQQQRAEIDPLLNTSPDGPAGQLNGILASHLREVWEVADMAWHGNDPDATEGSLLESLSAITGTTRAPATRSKFVGQRKVKVHLNAGTTLPALTTKFSVAGSPSIIFRTTEEISASSGTGFYYVPAECEQTGPISCNANTLTVIATPIAGLNSVVNEYDAELGRNRDNDLQLRERREKELRASGSGTVDSMAADVLAIQLEDGTKPILDVEVLENDGDETDANGLPPHSLEILVFDGVSAGTPNYTIAQTIWKSKPGGIQLVGSLTGTAIDSKNRQRTVPFTRATLHETLLHATLVLQNPNHVPAQYLGPVQQAVIEEFNARVKTGSVIRPNHYEAAIITKVPGIEDATVQLAFTPGPLEPPGVNLVLDVREGAYLLTTGVTVS